MFLEAAFGFFVYLGSVHCRDAMKPVRQLPMPTISNSLVNLGKMEIAFYFGKPEGAEKEVLPQHSLNLPLPNGPKIQLEEEPCPCTQFTSKTDSLLSKSSDLINQILMSNDLFKNPSSVHCCDSHEMPTVQESTYFLDMNAHQSPLRSPVSLPPFSLNPFQKLPGKPRTLEIILFPKRKDLANFEFTKNSQLKSVLKNIEQVGKELRFELPNEKNTVKKDLNDLEKKKKVEEINKATDNYDEAPQTSTTTNTI